MGQNVYSPRSSGLCTGKEESISSLILSSICRPSFSILREKASKLLRLAPSSVAHYTNVCFPGHFPLIIDVIKPSLTLSLSLLDPLAIIPMIGININQQLF